MKIKGSFLLPKHPFGSLDSEFFSRPYLEGIEKGREETLKEAVIGMLKEGLSSDQISKILKVSIDFIKQVDKSL